MADQTTPRSAVTARATAEPTTVLDRLDEWLERTPDADAVRCEDVTVTYSEVQRHACRLAWALRSLEVGPESVVGVAMGRSAMLPVALLGVLRAGAAYLPIDPNDPDDYISASFRAGGVRVVVTDPPLAERMTQLSTGLQVVGFDDVMSEAGLSVRTPASIDRDSLQYVIRTSGSTGRPKAIAMTHQPQARLIEWSRRRYAEKAVVLHYFPVTSDVASLDIFATWGTGGCLVVAKDAQRHDIFAIAELIATHSVTRVLLPVAVLHQLAEACASDFSRIASLRELITTGDRLTTTPAVRAMVTSLGEHAFLDDHYGSSEVNVVVAPRLEQPAAEWPDRPLLGTPIVDARVYVLEPGLTPAPRNVVGEIYIGGGPLARGYLGQGDLTADRFVPDPFSPVPGSRMYRTGDLGRWRTGGRLEFMGRNDFQIKVRGYRVEPAEIERVLAERSDVSRAAVLLVTTGPDDREVLTAYVVPARDASVNEESLRLHAAAAVPSPMVPEAFVVLDDLPLLATGKVDRSRLPDPNLTKPGIIAPRNDTEESIAEIWRDVLGKETVGVRENFFALGGHSLLVTRIVYELRETFDLDIPLVAMFQHPTIESLATRVDELIAQEES